MWLTWLKSNSKMVGYVTGVLALIVTLYQLHDRVYQSGYDAAVTRITAEHNKALEKQRQQYEQEIEKSLARINADYAQELERVRNEREIVTKIETVIEYVDREIKVPGECDMLVSDIVGVLKQATDIISTTDKEN